MKYFLITCIALMVASGFYGATDMVRDIRNKDLIDYENVRERHAKCLLFVIKTTGLGTYKFRGGIAGQETKLTHRVEAPKVNKPKVVQYFEEFSRGEPEIGEEL